MKRFLAVAAVALTAVAVYAAVAPAGPQAVTPKQFTALSKKVTTLEKKLTSVSKELGAFEACVPTGAAGIAQFGDLENNDGYVYSNSNNALEKETALDLAADPAPAYMLFTNKACADIINGRKKQPTSFGGAHR